MLAFLTPGLCRVITLDLSSVQPPAAGILQGGCDPLCRERTTHSGLPILILLLVLCLHRKDTALVVTPTRGVPKSPKVAFYRLEKVGRPFSNELNERIENNRKFNWLLRLARQVHL